VVSAQRKGDAHPGWTWRLPPLTLPSPSSLPSESSESSEYPDLESMTYEATPPEVGVREAGGSEVSEASEVSEDSEDSVVGGDLGGLRPPCFCEGCGRQAYWLVRPAYLECSKCHHKWLRPITSRSDDHGHHN
jgi:hypothetical protein